MFDNNDYQRVIAGLKETDKITAIAIQALVNRVNELSDNETLVLASDWDEAHENVDRLRYAELTVHASEQRPVADDLRDRVDPYLPSGWSARVVGKNKTDEHGNFTTDWVVSIVGYDNAGWTLEDYVLPRLASGNIFGKEVVWV